MKDRPVQKVKKERIEIFPLPFGFLSNDPTYLESELMGSVWLRQVEQMQKYKRKRPSLFGEIDAFGCSGDCENCDKDHDFDDEC